MTRDIARNPSIASVFPPKLRGVKAPIKISLPYDQSHAPWKRRGYHKEDAKAALRTRWGAMDAAERQATEGTSRDMDTSSSVLGKRTRHIQEPLAIESTGMGNNGKRLEIALVVDTSVVKEHAQWRNPDLKPQVEALQSSVVEGVDGAASSWAADECDRVLGREVSLEEEGMHAHKVSCLLPKN